MRARRLFALVLACAIVHACGGGSDEPDKTIDPPQCLEKPESCK